MGAWRMAFDMVILQKNLLNIEVVHYKCVDGDVYFRRPG